MGRIALFGAVALGACKAADEPPSAIAPMTVSAAMPLLEEVPLEGGATDLSLRPLSIALTLSGTMAVFIRDASNHQIASVDSNGFVTAKWGRFGEGPGEVRATDLLLSGDSVVVLAGVDGQPVRVFSPSGELLVQRSESPVGLPSAFVNGGLVWWTAMHVGVGPRNPKHIAAREGPVLRWCVFVACQDTLLRADDQIVTEISQATPQGGAWPPFASRGDISVFADGFGYRIWKVDHRNGAAPVQFGRALPPRMATDSQYAAADSEWVKLEQRGVPGPNGRVGRENFDREREFMRTKPLPYLMYSGLSFDEHGRLWVIGRETGGSMFLDVFADTVFLGRHLVNCDRAMHTAVVRGHWFATICEQSDPDDERFRLRLFRIVEPDASTASLLPHEP